MDNDTLINQARQLYAALNIKQSTQCVETTMQYDRLNRLIINAYCRYQRRLNHCVLCYQHQQNECDRDPQGNKLKFCPATFSHFHNYVPKPRNSLNDKICNS